MATLTGLKPKRFAPSLRFVRSRLGFRIAFSVFLSIILVEGAVLVPSYRSYETDLFARLEHASRATALAAFRPIAHGSERELLIGAEILVVNSDEIRGAALYEPGGRLIGRAGEAPSSGIGRAAAPGSRVSGRLEVLWPASDTRLPFSIVGRLDSEWIADELKAFIWRILGLVLIISFFVCAAAMFVFDRFVLTSIFRLRDQLVAARQDPTHPDLYVLRNRRTDELGEVLEAFNGTMNSLADGIRQLEDTRNELTLAKDHLEDQVDERTGALRAANKSLRREIEERERVEERLRHDALHDRLTGLANRALLVDRIGQAIHRQQRHEEQKFALVVFNLDRFKVVNENLGHPAGDQLINVIASRLKQAMRPEDTAARTLGDEFAVLIENASIPDGAIRCVERVIPSCIDQNPCAHFLVPMDMMTHG